MLRTSKNLSLSRRIGRTHHASGNFNIGIRYDEHDEAAEERRMLDPFRQMRSFFVQDGRVVGEGILP